MDHPQLDPESEAFVDNLVESGRYPSRQEVLREGVRLVQAREADLMRLRAAVQRGIDDADAGRVVDVDEAFDEMEAYIRELIDKRAA